MRIRKELLKRSDSKCELCGDTVALAVYTVPPAKTPSATDSILACGRCLPQLRDPERVEPDHWRCLNESIWSEIPAVKVVAWRMLNQLRDAGWPADLLNEMYLDATTLAWAKAGGPVTPPTEPVQHTDSNGQVLEAGDTVVLIKDLKVKGANFTAKRGTAVRRISLVADNPGQIEGKVNDQRIVILTEFVKKAK